MTCVLHWAKWNWISHWRNYEFVSENYACIIQILVSIIMRAPWHFRTHRCHMHIDQKLLVNTLQRFTPNTVINAGKQCDGISGRAGGTRSRQVQSNITLQGERFIRVIKTKSMCGFNWQILLKKQVWWKGRFQSFLIISCISLQVMFKE